jgi:hypothetical protein
MPEFTQEKPKHGPGMSDVSDTGPPTGAIHRTGRDSHDEDDGAESRVCVHQGRAGPRSNRNGAARRPDPAPHQRWFRHYALDQGLSMAELIRQILREFMAAHGGPAE